MGVALVTWRDLPLFDRRHPLPEHVLRARLRENAFDYIRDHPSSLPRAFFWNGLTRLWDVRRPARVLDEVRFEGRSRLLTWVGLALYWPLLVLALVTLWRERRNRALVWPVLAIALAASVVYTADGGTRYRAPLEPLIVVLACAAVWKPSGAQRVLPVSEGTQGKENSKCAPAPRPAAGGSRA